MRKGSPIASLKKAFEAGRQFSSKMDGSWWLCPFDAGDRDHQLAWLDGWTEGRSELHVWIVSD
jgi:ribosome modulation factor